MHYRGRSVPPNSYRCPRLEADGEPRDAHWTLGVRNESSVGNRWIRDPRGRRFSPRGPITEAKQEYIRESVSREVCETEHSDREVNSPPVLTSRPPLHRARFQARGPESSPCSRSLGGEEGHGSNSSKRANGTLSNEQRAEKWDRAVGRRSSGLASLRKQALLRLRDQKRSDQALGG